MHQIILIDSETAFNEAISEARLSIHPDRPNYAGKFMYMGTQDGKHLFKHIDTRRYLP